MLAEGAVEKFQADPPEAEVYHPPNEYPDFVGAEGSEIFAVGSTFCWGGDVLPP